MGQGAGEGGRQRCYEKWGTGKGSALGPLTQDTTRNRVWGRFAKLTGSKAAPARPAPKEAPSMAGPVPSVRLSRRSALPETARGCC